MFTCVNFQTALIALKKKKEKGKAVAHLLPVCLGAEMKTSKQIQIMVPGTIFVQVCFFLLFCDFLCPSSLVSLLVKATMTTLQSHFGFTLVGKTFAYHSSFSADVQNPKYLK